MPGPLSLTRTIASSPRRDRQRSTRPPSGVHGEGDLLVLGDRLIEIADLLDDVGEPDIAEAGEAAIMLDLGDPEERRDDPERLVEADDRLIGRRPHLIEGRSVLASPLEADAHAGERRPEVMG